MILLHDSLFELHTKNSTYLFRSLKTGQLEHLYYGERIALTNAEALAPKRAFPIGNGNVYSTEDANLCLEDVCLEVSGMGKGDLRDLPIELTFADGVRTTDFRYESAKILRGAHPLQGLPSSYDTLTPDSVCCPQDASKRETCAENVASKDIDAQVQTLEVMLVERSHKVKLYLYYTVYPDCDVITRSMKIVNEEAGKLQIEKAMSLQLDFDRTGLRFTSFHGAWAREMEKTEHIIESGRYVNSTSCGFSSNRNNNFVMLSDPDTTEHAGMCMGFHLVYSGNHYESLCVNAYEKSRLLTGVNPEGFSWTLSKGECFETPEAVMCFSAEGFTKLSHRLHRFVREHIVRGVWKHKERPVLVNSWEAAYFSFKEGSLMKLARAAKEVGAELFVLDDGWFGKRNTDTTSLGDWKANLKKLPGGLAGISKKVHALGLQFGIWVEPEMVNEDSDLYRLHPDYAVKIPNVEQSLGRNQMLLDLTKAEVRSYVIDAMREVFGTPGINYVKWDMNRVFSDAYTNALPPERQGEFYHRYILGLYEILETLTQEFPEILFESCASGGNRADLGMLCYMPQLWASDNTDAMARCEIQEGYSYGYPLSVLGCHVSGCPNHQTLRDTPLETRYNVASVGLLGYELNLCELSSDERKEIAAQIAQYKKWRSVVMDGSFYRASTEKACKWSCVSGDQTRAFSVLVAKQVRANAGYEKVQVKGLVPGKQYHFYNLPGQVDVMQFGSLINAVSPVHLKQNSMMHKLVAGFVKIEREQEDYLLSGEELAKVGVLLHPAYGGTGFNDQTRVFRDYASRMYYIEQA